jgi:hypothetical protein
LGARIQHAKKTSSVICLFSYTLAGHCELCAGRPPHVGSPIWTEFVTTANAALFIIIGRKTYLVNDNAEKIKQTKIRFRFIFS